MAVVARASPGRRPTYRLRCAPGGLLTAALILEQQSAHRLGALCAVTRTCERARSEPKLKVLANLYLVLCAHPQWF